jgi:hypothetical protein
MSVSMGDVVRMALGAIAAAVRGIVVAEGLRVVAVGVAIGLLPAAQPSH